MHENCACIAYERAGAFVCSQQIKGKLNVQQVRYKKKNMCDECGDGDTHIISVLDVHK